MHLRKLEERDAPFMLEWQKDPEIMCFFRFDASNATVESCAAYIRKANQEINAMHYAIANENDEYLGTISLKDIDFNKGTAEYAVSTRRKAHGTGCAGEATKAILKIAFDELRLNLIYLNVLTDNGRANAFYRKVGFVFERCDKNAVEIRGEMKDLNWYNYFKENFHA